VKEEAASMQNYLYIAFVMRAAVGLGGTNWGNLTCALQQCHLKGLVLVRQPY